MTAPSYLQDAKQRVMAMEKEAVLSLYPNGVDAVPYFFYVGNTFPYWTTRLGTEDKQINSQELSDRTYDFIMRYIIGHLTEQAPGDVENTLDRDVPTIEDYFDTHRFLQSAAYPLSPDYVDPIGVYMSMTTGLAVFNDSGINVQQIGVEFTLKVKFCLQTDPAY